MDRFQQLLWDLGELVNLPLHADSNHACTLALDDALEVQLEMDSHGEHLLVAATISEIPPGKFRENVLKEGLKANNSYHPFGVFAYLERASALILHRFFDAESLSGEKLLHHLEGVIEESEEWRKAIASSQASPAKYQGP